ncbi:MgtC/SapB family protein [Paenibacillus hamazuiensis]|uniref:MgtC/SapB family protein n=1 Tax=Paenibacillus hamazuiensis TaxID=2936508 RepID=UPI00200E841D|nr:MgtC/SapB family protein [Paenibacillus hamazuiensis]
MTAVSGDIWHITHLELFLRMVLAAVLGGAIGMEREWSNHAAGFRTHILVCLGSATIMLLSIYGFSEFVNETNVRVDPARLAAQVISGIGFLGAGAILRNGSVIKGLTTAASIWVVAAIGLCVGAGFFTGALIGTFLVLVSLYLLNKWEKHLLWHRRPQEVNVEVHDFPGALGRIASAFGECDIQIANVKMRHEDQPAGDSPSPLMHLSFTLKSNTPEKLAQAFEAIFAMEFVTAVEAAHFGVRKKQPAGGEGNSLSL